jgi:hypothetical protein
MALTFGQVLSGAGAVSTGQQQAEANAMQARQSQLAIEAQNRADAERQQLAAFQARQQIPNMPDFTGAAGGQQYQAPQQPQAGLNVQPQVQPQVQAQPSVQVQPPVQPAAVAPTVQPPQAGLQPPQTGSPAGRFASGVVQSVKDIDETANLRNEMRRKYSPAAGIGGLFKEQTDVQRQEAQNILTLINTLDKTQLEELKRTGKIPAPKQTLLQAQKQVESGGDTTAVSPKGATGLMQVMIPTAMDPGFGMPNIFDYAEQQGVKVNARTEAEASRLLKIPELGEPYGQMYSGAMNRKYGGNTAVMLAAYNWGPGNTDKWVAAGGDPNKLPKETKDYVVKVMSQAGMEVPPAFIIGSKPAQTADNVAEMTKQAATSGVMYGPSSVAGGAQNPSIQSAVMLRNLMVERYKIASNVGNAAGAMEAMQQVAGIDLGLYKAQADQGVYELMSSGDAGRAMSVLSQFTGIPTQALDRGDGTYDLYQNGRIAKTAVPVNDLADLVKTQVDTGYREGKIALNQKMAVIGLEKGLVLKQEEIKQIGAIQKAMIDGNFKLLEKQAEKEGKLTVDSTNGITYIQSGGRTYAITSNKVEVAGVPQTTFSRTEVK